MKKQFVEITTYDTKKTYHFSADGKAKNPQLWEVKLQIGTVGSQGHTKYGLSGNDSIYLERQTLEDAGLIPLDPSKTIKDTGAEVRTPEDLILELLEIVGVYPQE